MAKIYRITWVEEQHLLESYRHEKIDAETLKNDLENQGLYPCVTCDFTENQFRIKETDFAVSVGEIYVRRRIE